MAKKRGNGEGCIRQLKNGYWEARVTIGYNEKGKQKFKVFSGKTRQVVAQKLNNYIANEKGKEPEQACKDTLSAWLDKWYESYVVPNVKTSTRVSYEMVIRRHLKPSIGNIKLKDLKKDTIEELYNKLIVGGRTDGKGGLSPKTVKNVHLVLHMALEEAARREYIIKNPASIAKVPTMKSTNSKKKDIEILSKDEQKLLEAACSTDVYGTAIKLDLYTGMRLGELLGLQWPDINFENRTISISRQLNRLKDFDPKATAKTKLEIQDDVKTATSYRVISIAPTIVTMLQTYKAQQDIESKKWGKAHKKLQMVFARDDGSFIDPSTFREHYKQTLRKACLKNCTVHALRHTFATRALEAGVPIKVVSNILGHAGVQITMDTYSHVLPQLQEAAMIKIAEYIAELKASS